MANLIQPVCATQAQVALYLGMNAATLAATLGDGVTTLGGYIDACLLDTAWALVKMCDYDFTTSQKGWDSWQGNDTPWHELDYSMTTGTSFVKCPIGGNPFIDNVTLNGGTDIAPAFRAPNAVQGKYKIFCVPSGPNKLTSFDSNYIYTLEYTCNNANTARPYIQGTITGWPLELMQVQIEMIAVRIRESAIGYGGGTTSQSKANAHLGRLMELPVNNLPGHITFIDMLPRWEKITRRYRRFSI